jgi:hypothetical protein
VPGYFGEPQREVTVVLGLLLVLWVRTVALPRPVVRATGQVAAASLAIYLTHWQVFPPVRDAAGGLPAFGAALAAGLGAWWASRTVARRARARWAQRRAGWVGSGAPSPAVAPTGP